MSETTVPLLKYQSGNISKDKQLSLYNNLLRPRRIEEKMLKLLRQGRISKWFSGIGQEAIAVGVAEALKDDEYIFTMHRNLGVFTTRQVPLHRLFSQWQGKATGYTKGRDRSFHFGAPEHHIVGMISHLGPQLSLACGVGLAHKLDKSARVAVAFSGEGGTSQGEFHEAMNVAAVWKLPVIFVIENNGYGLSTPTDEQFCCENIADKGIGYGMRSMTIDGNNVLEVYETVSHLATALRQNPEPVLLECNTFRMRGHEEASGTKYVPDELMNHWAQRDPLENYKQHLQQQGILSDELEAAYEQALLQDMNQALDSAFAESEMQSTTAVETADVYAPYVQPSETPDDPNAKEIRLVDAITDGLRQAMRRHDKLVLMGQDIAEYGGVFKITQGFVEEFGRERVRNTPLCESAIIGTALGLSLEGRKAMVEMQFADFVTCGFNQIINNLAKLHYRWAQNADVVIRMPTGAGVAAGPFHSQSNEAWFAHTPGLKVVYPSNPHDAKGLLLTAFDDPNPVMYFEHKALYRSISGPVSEDYYQVPIGKAALARVGTAASIITYGMGVHWAKKAVEEMGADVEIIDLRTLLPLDLEAIEATVRKTNRVLVLHEDTFTGGIGGEVSAYISEQLFEHLDAPVVRVASLDTPVPFAAGLEADFLPEARLRERLRWLLGY